VANIPWQILKVADLPGLMTLLAPRAVFLSNPVDRHGRSVPVGEAAVALAPLRSAMRASGVDPARHVRITAAPAAKTDASLLEFLTGIGFLSPGRPSTKSLAPGEHTRGSFPK
jgi:hypothetical protein